MSLLGYLAMLGLGTLLISEIHTRPGREGAFVGTAVAVSGVAGLVVGGVATLVATRVSPELAAIAATPIGVVAFVLGVGLTASTLVLDQALVGLLRSQWQFVRNLVFAGGKLVVLVAAGALTVAASGSTIVAAWVVGLVLSVLPLAWIALRANRDIGRFWPSLEIFGHLRSGIFAHHALNLSLQAPSLAMPLMVALVLSPAAAAYFYTAWMIAGFVSIGTAALAMTLFSVGSRDAAARVHATRLALLVSTALVIAAIIALVLLGPLILGLFGGRYGAEAQGPLVLLALAALPGIIKAFFVQVCRFERRLVIGAAILTVAGIAELAGGVAGAYRGGITGVAAGFLLVSIVEALAMAPAVLRSAGLVPSRDRAARAATAP
jgi:O-antigen/teichoic acid export membrane protein